MENIINTIYYLRKIQKIFFETNGGFLENQEAIKSILINKYSLSSDEISKHLLDNASTKCLTEYQNPGQYRIIKMYTDLIDEIKEEVLYNEKLLVKPIPIWGTVNMYQFSAQISPPTEGIDNIILLSTGLMTYALLICKIVAKSFPILGVNGHKSITIDKDLIISKIDANPEIELRFIDLMLSYLLTGEARCARQYMLDEFSNFITDPMIVGFECFAIAHEYSHYLLGHLEKDLYNIKSLNLSKTKIDEIIHNWDDEISADSLGIKLTLKSIENSGLNSDLGLVGIFLCLKSFELFERLILICNKEMINSVIISETHPPAKSRIDNFIENIVSFERNASLISTIDIVIDHLWDIMLMKFKEWGIDSLLNEMHEKEGIDHISLQKKIYEYYSIEWEL